MMRPFYVFSYFEAWVQVCAVTYSRYLIEGVIWQRLPIFANGKPLFAGNGNALHRRVIAVGKKAYKRGAVK